MDPLTLSKAFFCVIALLLGYYVTLYWAGLGGLFGRARALGWGRIGGLILGAQSRAMRHALLPWGIVAALGAAGYWMTEGETQSIILFVTLMSVITLGVRAGALGNFDQIAEAGGPTAHRVARVVGAVIGLLTGGFMLAVLFLLP